MYVNEQNSFSSFNKSDKTFQNVKLDEDKAEPIDSKSIALTQN